MSAKLYKEKYRPQFHFSAKNGWFNDAIGLVFYKGEYHVSFLNIPNGSESEDGLFLGVKRWGQAISPDLVHWTELDPAICPGPAEAIKSGSAVVDWANTSGLQTGGDKVIVAFYTLASPAEDGSGAIECTQCMAYSNDRGRTWLKYAGNPVIPNIKGGNRDPRVFWYEPNKKWIMAFYIPEGDIFTFFESRDLKFWMHLQDYHFPGHGECPDLFPMKVDGDESNVKWILVVGNGDYMIGNFNGHQFSAESGPYVGDYGGNYYATQTFSDMLDGRRIQMAWMRHGQYPDMPFDQQMNFPTELDLKLLPVGLRLCRMPVKEIENVHREIHKFDGLLIQPGENLLSGIQGDLFDIQAEIEVGDVTEFGFRANGEMISYSVSSKLLACTGKSVKLEPVNGCIKLRILVDRTSIEVYGNDGEVVMTSCYLPTDDGLGISAYSFGKPTKARSLCVHELESSWLTS